MTNMVTVTGNERGILALLHLVILSYCVTSVELRCSSALTSRTSLRLCSTRRHTPFGTRPRNHTRRDIGSLVRQTHRSVLQIAHFAACSLDSVVRRGHCLVAHERTPTSAGDWIEQEHCESAHSESGQGRDRELAGYL